MCPPTRDIDLQVLADSKHQAYLHISHLHDNWDYKLYDNRPFFPGQNLGYSTLLKQKFLCSFQIFDSIKSGPDPVFTAYVVGRNKNSNMFLASSIQIRTRYTRLGQKGTSGRGISNCTLSSTAITTSSTLFSTSNSRSFPCFQGLDHFIPFKLVPGLPFWSRGHRFRLLLYP